MEWHHWCRLCGKENENQINIVVKEENSFSIADTIHQFFAIQMDDLDEIPKNICLICNEFLVSLQDFSEKVRKVEKMFVEIDFNYKTGQKFDIFEIKAKYLGNFNNVIDDNKNIDNLLNHKLEVNYISSKNNFDVNITSESISSNIKESNTQNIENENHLNNATRLSQDESYLDDKPYNNSIVEEFKDEITDSEKIDQKSKYKKKSKLNMKLKNKQKKYLNFTEETKKFECEECQMKFVRESNYACHLKKAHNSIKPLLPCNICGKICKTKQKLKFHMELHLPPEEREKLLFKCPECDQKFTQKGAMRSHVRAQHSLEKPFVCEQCGKIFASQTNLWSHRRSHDDQNHLACSKCPKIFKNKFRLRVHMRGHSDSCHPCSVCGLVLKTMKTLNNHMLVHSDEKPFKCNFCGKDFKRDKNLQNHMITHSGLRPFICRFCGQSYANRSNCKKHEKHSHPNEYEVAASATSSEPQQKVVKKLPNIQQLEAMLEQIKSEKGENVDG